jgi:hypothetical protein
MTSAEDAPAMRQRPACLSLSPLRALPAARLDSAQGSWWRDRMADSLRPRLNGTGWVLAAAGKCPDGLPVLDAFQQPGDLTRDADGALVKVRVEWRHRGGTTIALLDDPDHPENQLGLWATQLFLTANLQLGRVEVLADRGLQVLLRTESASWRRWGETPLEWSQAPGPLQLRIQGGGVQKDIDTLLETGQSLKLRITTPPVARRRSRWELPAWTASALCLAGGLWYSLEMEQAYARYARLDAQAPDGAFSTAWSDVRQANLLRNVLLAGSGTFLAGALYVHFR